MYDTLVCNDRIIADKFQPQKCYIIQLSHNALCGYVTIYLLSPPVQIDQELSLSISHKLKLVPAGTGLRYRFHNDNEEELVEYPITIQIPQFPSYQVPIHDDSAPQSKNTVSTFQITCRVLSFVLENS